MIEIDLSKTLEQVATVSSLEELESLRLRYLGRKGIVSEGLKNLSKLGLDERKQQGAILNKIKNRLGEAIALRKEKLTHYYLDQRLDKARPDLTLPVRTKVAGRIHPIRRIIEESVSIFAHMGFVIKEGPDIEKDIFNFSKLNFPQDHPARQMQDTFFLNAKDEEGNHKLLRTHTSPVQIRTLLEENPPLKIMSAGRTFRCDSDQTHAPMFHQIEGILVDKSSHLGHLKGCLETFCRTIFGVKNLELRFRPSFFPFTEPSLEVDIKCHRTPNKIVIGKGDEWLEILGCGMVHPNVLSNCGHNPEVYQGFAFGIGVERIAMLKYGIPDLRAFTQGNVNWLKHYGFDSASVASTAYGLNPITA